MENKGRHIAIEALVRLPEFSLVIAGEGPERQALESLANQLKVSAKVTFLGWVTQSQLVKSYSAADMLVLPSSREGWPNVLLESMACGTPVVATDVGGIPEIITSPVVGCVITRRTVDNLVDAVIDLWQTLPDWAQVRSYVQTCSWESTTDAQIKLFSQIAAATLESVNA